MKFKHCYGTHKIHSIACHIWDLDLEYIFAGKVNLVWTYFGTMQCLERQMERCICSHFWGSIWNLLFRLGIFSPQSPPHSTDSSPQTCAIFAGTFKFSLFSSFSFVCNQSNLHQIFLLLLKRIVKMKNEISCFSISFTVVNALQPNVCPWEIFAAIPAFFGGLNNSFYRFSDSFCSISLGASPWTSLVIGQLSCNIMQRIYSFLHSCK